MVVQICLLTCETGGTFACITCYGVVAYSAVSARTGDAIVDVGLTVITGESRGTGAGECVD